ncbi:hypothetical protein BEL04_13560 [Mucilaginibacter sp. PPCGB 2223]|uniref:hypothetical protein n=1 Tax=Mucilaginibacter sp. PPCGB 2223 TaxID=1886027 RepID=UPI000825575F|nr:hypothetical protein [Mucilaginibacter sp. PPCGB 2223]OCX52484.1 hypothetical protein BEL04_13560 [Mucilaginibacter sp. PPCGB 2223]
MKKQLFILLIPLLVAGHVNAQTETGNAPTTLPFIKTSNDVEKTSSILKTGIANDVLTNAYKIAIKNIFGDKKEASYSSTIYGTIRIFNPNFGSGAAYRGTRWARNVEWTVSGKVDSNSNIAGFGGTLKVTLLNKRDLTVRSDELTATMNNYSNIFIRDVARARSMLISNVEGSNLSRSKKDSTIRIKLNLLYSSIRKYGKSSDITDLDPDLLSALITMNSPIVNDGGLAAKANADFKNAVNEIKNKPLWTLSGTYFHVPYGKNDTTTIQSDLVFGLSKDSGSGFWEFNASGYARFFNNGLLGSAQKYHFESGCNRVLREDANGKSNMEIKGFFSYDRGNNAPGFPTATTANITYRYLVDKFGGFWIPVTLSYNPNNGRFLGLIDLTINIDPKN